MHRKSCFPLVNTLHIMIAVCGLQLYAQSPDPRLPPGGAARAAAARRLAGRAANGSMAAATVSLPAAPGTFITFDAPGATCSVGPLCGTFAISINPAGEILGYTFDSSGASSAFLRSNQGTFTTFGVSGAQFFNIGTSGPAGSSLNPAGTGTGFYFDSNGFGHGFVSDSRGTITTFDAPGAVETAALSINPAGAVTGYFADANFVNHGFFRDSNGTLTEFDAPGAGCGLAAGTLAFGINAAGETTGFYYDSACFQHGFLRAPNGAMTVVDIPGSTRNQPQTINNRGDIAGIFNDATFAEHGFVRDINGLFTTFDIPNAVGYGQDVSSGMNINPSGVITGGYFDVNGAVHGFRRAADGTLTTLDVPGAGAGTGFDQGTLAQSINPAGVITGYYFDANGVAHGFLFLPQ